MNKLQLSINTLAGLFLLPAASFAADDISYSYIEADYIVQNIDLFEDQDVFDDFLEDVDDGDGFKLGASLSLTQNLFIFGNYSNTEADFTFVDDTGLVIPQGQDIKTVNLGLGFNAPLNNQMDFVGRVSYLDVDYGEFSFGQNDDDVNDLDDIDNAFNDLDEDSTDGFAIDAGVRTQVAEWLELGGGLRYTDLDTGDDFSAFGNALFEINQNFGINLAANVGDNLTSYQLGLRYTM